MMLAYVIVVAVFGKACADYARLSLIVENHSGSAEDWSLVRSMGSAIVPSYASALAEARIHCTCLIVERPVDLVLILHEDIRADGFPGFEIAAAAPVGGVVGVARALVFRGLRVGAQRPREGRRQALANHLVRRDAFLDPIDECREVGAVLRPGSRGAQAEDRRAAVADAGRVEQAVEALHALEACSIVPSLVALRNLPVVVEHAARIDELVVRTDERDHLSAACLEGVERAERVGHIGDVSGTGLRHIRVRKALASEADRGPLGRRRSKARIDQIPFKLGNAKRKWSRTVENGEVAAAS
jgi:hypothetical protein